jgi:hypothetical protein
MWWQFRRYRQAVIAELLLNLLPSSHLGSTIRSAQCLSVFCAVVILLLGIGCFLGIRSGFIPPLPGHDIVLSLAGVFLDTLVLLLWKWDTRTHRERAIGLWMAHGDSEELRNRIVSGWATQRVRFIKPLVFTTLIGLMGAGFASSLLAAVSTTGISFGIWVWAFPTAKRAAAMLAVIRDSAAARLAAMP